MTDNGYHIYINEDSGTARKLGRKAIEDAVSKTRRLARENGFTGDICTDCGSSQMVRNGTCLKCNACGATTGCS